MRARDNPFATGRLHALRVRLPAGVTWDGLWERFAAMNYRAALVGPEGAGKTTLLEALAPRFEARGFRIRRLQLTRDRPRFDPAELATVWREVDRRDLILFDGAEQLGPLAWRRFRRRSRAAGGLLVTLHRPGRLPTLLECRTSVELLDDLVGELLGDLTPARRQRNRELFAAHQGNLRLALRAWYDDFAGR